jgi:serine-type D-Ala-D-Ala carboxypeptidase (penicillin-binding protein 5/6)
MSVHHRPEPAAAVAVVTALLFVLLASPSVAGPTASAIELPRDDTGAPPVGGPLMASVQPEYRLAPGVRKPPTLPAKGYLLADLTTGRVLVARDVHRRLMPASTLKVLTALTLLPRLDPNRLYRATAVDEDMDGSKVGIVARSHYTIHQLFVGMMLSSGNDAANALANAAGGTAKTVALMQARATGLGALDTTARDDSGLDAPGQRSSAYDLALIARAAMQRPDFRQLVSTKIAHFPGKERKGKKRKTFEIQNHNKLLGSYPGTIGVKNGYTVHAKWSYIGAVRRHGHTYLVTEMGLSRPGFGSAEKMFDWAFAYASSATPVGQLVEPGSLSTATGTTSTPVASSPPVTNDVAGSAALNRTSGTTRLLGIVGLVGAAIIVGGLGLAGARRRS